MRGGVFFKKNLTGFQILSGLNEPRPLGRGVNGIIKRRKRREMRKERKEEILGNMQFLNPSGVK